MDVIFPDVGLPYILRQTVGTKLVYHLFANDHTPGLADTLASYTDPVWSGYAPIDVPLAAWILSSMTGHVGGLQALDIVFTNTSPSDWPVFGYYVTDAGGSFLVAAARFDIAPKMVLSGSFVQVTPQLGTYSGLTA